MSQSIEWRKESVLICTSTYVWTETWQCARVFQRHKRIWIVFSACTWQLVVCMNVYTPCRVYDVLYHQQHHSCWCPCRHPPAPPASGWEAPLPPSVAMLTPPVLFYFSTLFTIGYNNYYELLVISSLLWFCYLIYIIYTVLNEKRRSTHHQLLLPIDEYLCSRIENWQRTLF